MVVSCAVRACLAVAFACLGISAARADDADRVLVVRNLSSEASKLIAADYIRRRPHAHVVDIKCSDSSQNSDAETIDFRVYKTAIEKPIEAYLDKHSNIDFIVLTEGIPLRLRNAGLGNSMGYYALDSHLAALGYDHIKGVHPIDIHNMESPYLDFYSMVYHYDFHGRAYLNRYRDAQEPFSHAKFGGYLVTRLDGYTVDDALALTRRAQEAEQAAGAGTPPKGVILLNPATKTGFGDISRPLRSFVPPNLSPGETVLINNESEYSPEYNSDIVFAASQLKRRGIPVELELRNQFVAKREGLMGYVSWGSNDPNYTLAAYKSLKFAPGSIAETAVSTGARTFLPRAYGQSLIADLVHQGVTGVKGYTDEPLAEALASPNIMFDRYTRGWTLAESFYAASAMIGWQDIVVGDPIARAYPKAN